MMLALKPGPKAIYPQISPMTQIQDRAITVDIAVQTVSPFALSICEIGEICG